VTVPVQYRDAGGTLWKLQTEPGDESGQDRFVHTLPQAVVQNIADTASRLASVVTALTNMSGYTDGLEALITTLNGYSDGLEALVGTTNSTLTTLQGYVDQLEGYTDGLETLIAATNTALSTIASNQGPPSALYGDSKNVTTATTRVQIQSSSQALTEGVWVRAKDANTGIIYVGNASVSATTGGTRLAAKEQIFVRINNLNAVYIDASVSGEGVTFLGW
jgi:hypothetical protein